MKDEKPRQFRKKPVVVSGMQYDGTLESAEVIKAWVNKAGGHAEITVLRKGHTFEIRTTSGLLPVPPHNFVIGGIIGFGTIKPRVLAENYDEVTR